MTPSAVAPGEAPAAGGPPPGDEPARRPLPRRTGDAAVRMVRENAVAIFVAVLLLWLIGGPLWFLIRMSLADGTPADPGAWTVRNYAALFDEPRTWPAVLNTLYYSVGVSAISLTVAITAAWLVERTDMPGRNAAWVAMLAPLAIPGILASMAWILMLSPGSGALNVLIRGGFDTFLGIDLGDRGPFDIFSLPGMIFVEGMRGTTTVFLLIVGAFRLMDPAMEDAAALSGARPLQTLRKVTLPLMFPALLAAGIFAFLGNLQDFETPLLLGLPAGIYILPTLIYFIAYQSPLPSWGMATAYASLFMLVMAALTYWYYKAVIVQRRKFATVGGKSYRPQRIPLKRWRYPALCLFIVFFMLSVGLPLLMLMWASLIEGGYAPPSREALSRVGLGNYIEFVNDRQTMSAFWRSTMLAVVTATIGMAVAVSVSWAVVRLRVRGGLLMDAMAFAPNAIPTICIGLGLVVLYLNPVMSWTGLYGSFALLAIGLVVNYLAFSTRLSNGAMAQLSAELEEQAWVAGRGKFTTLVRVTVPLVMPTMIAGWVWVAAHAFRNLTIPLVLGTGRTPLLSVRLYRVWELENDLTYAATIAIVFMLVIVIGTIGARRLITRGFTSE